MTTITMAAIAGVPVVAGLCGIVWLVAFAKRPHDPQGGVARGCLMLCAIPLALVGVAIACGVIFDVPVLVRWPFYGVVVLAAWVGVSLIGGWAARQRERRAVAALEEQTDPDERPPA